MKKIIILLLSCAIALTVGGLTVFADSEKAELRLDETSMNFYESDEPQFSDGKYALSEYLSFTLSDGKEVNILTDGSQKTVQILNEDWEEGELKTRRLAARSRTSLLEISARERILTALTSPMPGMVLRSSRVRRWSVDSSVEPFS